MLLPPIASSLQRADIVVNNRKVIGIDYNNLKALCRDHDPSRESSSNDVTLEAHQTFMKSFRNVFICPKKVIPCNSLKTDKFTLSADGLTARHSHLMSHVPNQHQPALDPIRTSQAPGNPVEESFSKKRRNALQGKLAQKTLISHVIKALKKFPMDRTELEIMSVQKLLKMFPCIANQLTRQEFNRICTITFIESWDRGQIIFAESGFYLILKGSVRPYPRHASEEDLEPAGPAIGVGCSFGSFESPSGVKQSMGSQCMMALEACEILKMSHSGLAKLKQEIQSEIYIMKESLIQKCQFYLQWPKLSVEKLAMHVQMRTFLANHVLAKEGKVCPFAVYIKKGECNILQNVNTVIKTALEKKFQSVRIKAVVVGKLGPMESFGEVSILLDQPSPCSIVAATEVQVGIIQPNVLKALDKVTTALMLQSAQPTYGNLSQEEINKDYLRQERIKEWEHIKRKVLNDSMFYNGIQEGVGKWTFCRGTTKPTQKKLPEL